MNRASHWLTMALLLGVACQEAPPATQADLVIFGTTWTGDSLAPWAQGLAVRDSILVAVGDSASVAEWIGTSTEVLWAGTGMVVPGLMDNHAHFMSGGFQLAQADLRDAATPLEFATRIGAYAKTLEPGEWILGGDWDHELWAGGGGGYPQRDWIDSLTPDNPVFVTRLDGHMGLANSLALEAAGFSESPSDIAGGVILRYPGSQKPTGLLKDNAMDPMWAAIPNPSPSQRDSALARALAHAAEHGVTAVAEMNGGWNNWAAYRRAHAAGTLTARVALYHPLGNWAAFADTMVRSGRGDDWLWWAGLKGFVDGSLGSTTAAFEEPYHDEPGTRGTLVVDEDSLRSWIGGADSVGLALAIHAIGDRANALLLDIFDSVAMAHGQRDRRFRIEHAQHLHRKDVDRFQSLGVIASMQPFHAIDDGRWAENRIGPERIKTTYAFRSLLDADAVVTFGSDWTVGPLDPLAGIYGAVTRRTIDGQHPGGWVPEERITVEDALWAYTSANAFGFFLDDRVGRLRTGYLADLVVVDQNLTSIPPEAIDQVSVLTTVVGGRIVYRATGLPSDPEYETE